MLKLGEQNISGLYLGEEKIEKAYLGETLMFSAGKPSRLPEGYTELEYIESTGTQAIDSGVFPTSTLKVEIDIFPEKRQGAIFGSWAAISSSSWVRFFIILANSSSSTTLRVGYGLNSYKNEASPEQTPLNRVFVYMISNGNLANYAYKDYKGVISGEGNFAKIPTCGILAYHSNTGYSDYLIAKLYSCKMYMGETPVRDFVPCIDPSGDVGLYDLVGNQFYANAGTGTFTAGPAV